MAITTIKPTIKKEVEYNGCKAVLAYEEEDVILEYVEENYNTGCNISVITCPHCSNKIKVED